jgi:hypothetical protein
MSILRDIVARFGVDVDASDLSRLDGTLENVLSGVEKVAGAFMGWGVTQRVMAFTDEMTNLGDELAMNADRLQTSATSLQELQHAATMTDVAHGALASGLDSLARRAQAAATGNSTLRRSFGDLGVELMDANGNLRSSSDLLTDIADGFSGVESPSERTALAMRLFGGAGNDLLPMLSRGSAGIAELRAEFRALGGGMSEEMVSAAGDLDDEMNRLDVTTLALKSRIAVVLLPAVREGVERFVRLSAAFLDLAGKSNLVQAAFVVLGGAALAAGIKFALGFAGPIAIFAAVAIAVAFIILLVDDLITMFDGGTSVIGGFLDELFGVGTSADVVNTLREAWEGLVMIIHDAKTAVQEFLGLGGEGETASGDPVATSRGLDPSTAISAAEDRARTAEREAQGSWMLGTVESDRRQQRATELRAAADAEAASRAARIGVEGRTGRVPARGAAGPTVDARTDVRVTVDGSGDPEVAARRTGAVVEEILERRGREAAAALGQTAEDEG